jgi:hypothetical protein
MDTPQELEWYLRDHLFRQSGKGRTQFERNLIAAEMVSLYLRYREYDPQDLSRSMDPVLDRLVSVQVLRQNGSTLEMGGQLVRMQCSKCFYINYLVEKEQKSCQRCGVSELHEFPKKRQ